MRPLGQLESAATTDVKEPDLAGTDAAGRHETLLGDQEVAVPSKPVKEEATLRWLPFGRDELVVQPPTAKVAAHLNPEADETYSAFPDRAEPDTEAAAFHVKDVEVPQPPSSARLEPPDGFLYNGTGAGGHWDTAFALEDFMDDEYVAQMPVAASPRKHRAHTDFDFQGLLPDVAGVSVCVCGRGEC